MAWGVVYGVCVCLSGDGGGGGCGGCDGGGDSGSSRCDGGGDGGGDSGGDGSSMSHDCGHPLLLGSYMACNMGGVVCGVSVCCSGGGGGGGCGRCDGISGCGGESCASIVDSGGGGDSCDSVGCSISSGSYHMGTNQPHCTFVPCAADGLFGVGEDSSESLTLPRYIIIMCQDLLADHFCMDIGGDGGGASGGDSSSSMYLYCIHPARGIWWSHQACASVWVVVGLAPCYIL